VSTPVHGCDWLPTLYSLAGQSAPVGANPFDGVNLMPLLEGKPAPAVAGRFLPFQRNRYAPVRHVNASIREGRWKLVWPGDEGSFKKDSGRDNPSFGRGILHPHWEMPLDRHLDADPAELHDLAAAHPEIVQSLAQKHDAWFVEVIADWQQSRAHIVAQDRAYWKDRPAPDPAALFKDYWQWKAAPKGTDPKTADPLKVFRGFWSNSQTDQ
jgi:arylsulfatase A-like enzyme